MDWWRNQIGAYFDIVKTIQGGVIDGVSTTSKFVCRPKQNTGVLPVSLDADPKAMWISDTDKQKLEAVPLGAPVPDGQPVLAEGLPTIAVEADGTTVRFINVNQITEWRAKTLLTKEPVTIKWIEAMEPDSILFDVGANMGGYSVWANKRRGAQVYAFEPESGNYALLCRNFVINDVKGAAYCVALTNEAKLGQLFTSSNEVGGSCHSFDQAIGFDLKPRDGVPQGSVGLTMDELVTRLGLPYPNYVKIDVDGLEHNVIAGALKILTNPALKGLIVEVNTNLAEHRTMVERLRTCYFGLEIFGLAPMFTYRSGRGEIEIIEETEASISLGLRAQMAGIGFMPGRAWLGTDLPRLRPDVHTVTDPYNGETLMAFPAIYPDISVIHALRADPDGNAEIGINKAIDEELTIASGMVIITAEEIVPALERATLVAPFVHAVVHVPRGAAPSSCHPLYPLDGEAILAYTEQVSDPASLEIYLKHILGE
jgi:FkbM family methyltransferase